MSQLNVINHAVLTFAAFLVVHQLEAVVAAAVEATDKVRADVSAAPGLLGAFVNVYSQNSERNTDEGNKYAVSHDTVAIT